MSLPSGVRAYYRAKRERVMRDSILAEADRILDHLAGMPLGEDACLVPVLRRIMLKTGGRLLVNGHSREIISKAIGGGVYRISLAALDAGKGEG